MKIIIVGGGLSGITLAHQLEEKKIDFRIIDEGINHSTKVAAGMINPMTFRRMIKTWKGDELIPTLKEFYPAIEKKIKHKFFFQRKLRRAFNSEHERDLWMERLEENEYDDYLNPPEDKKNTPSHLKAPFGNGFLSTPGYVDAKKFMQYNHDYFIEKGLLEYGKFDFSELDPSSKTYKNEEFSHLIFCEGYKGEDNPYFGYLPFSNAKGEVLTVNSDVFDKNEILNKKCFILPTENGDFKLGATYAWYTQDTSPTEEAKKELLENYNLLSSAPIEVIDHEAGIRPAVADRRPLIGEHPTHKGLYIFNGLGSKGYMIAPYCAIEFVDFLMGKGEIDQEADIQRFYKKHFNKQ
ncbi:NAD(P)/FAD-dependent oxidoreductase [Brumimicrobium oceani]|uniref:NAD(P)/FAD-dependent oxidoreductase n=1 Tax=Brumimicrobium oceani TaxID=2100725 RepID=UPI0013049A78|nr:FAD-dependent oxidoreductase [Brumimicrobium oceani]